MEVKAAVAESLDPASAAFDADLLSSQADASFHEIQEEQDPVAIERGTCIREDSASGGMKSSERRSHSEFARWHGGG